MKKLLLLSTIALLSTPSFASDCKPFVLAGNISRHFGNNDTYRNEHPSIGGGCEYDNGDIVYSTQAIYTKNSYDRDSVFLTGNINPVAYRDDNIRVSVGLTLGAATGYEPIKASKHGIIPIVGINGEICGETVCGYALVLPNYSNADGVITGGLKFPIDWLKPERK